MRHLILFLVLSFVMLTQVNSLAMANADRFLFDKAHTQILFFVNHLGFSNSQGEFHDYDGEILFDLSNPAESSVEIVIQTKSIDMDDEKWDDHLKNEDFFNVNLHPEMLFKSTAIELTGENTALISGDLTLLGVTKPVVLDTTFNKAGRHPFNQKFVAGFSAKTTIKRSEWGMNYGLPMIGDDVQVVLEVEAIRQDEEGQEAVNQ